MAQRKREDDSGQAEVSRAVEDTNEQGFFGTAVDPTPNDNYTVAGVTSGKPTPETDAKAAEKAREAAGLR